MHQPDEEADDYPKWRGNHYGSVGGGDSNFRKVLDSLILLGIPAVIGVIWSMSNNVAVLATQISTQHDEIRELKTEIQDLRNRILKNIKMIAIKKY